MAEPEAVQVALSGGWSVLATGARRDKQALTADLVLQNGRPVYCSSAVLNDPEAQRAWATAAAGEGRPTVDELAAAVVALVVEVAATLQATVKPSQADKLTTLLTDPGAGLELWHDPDRVPVATVPAGDHAEHWPVRSRAFREYCSHRYYREYGKTPGVQAVQDALNAMSGTAQHDGEERQFPTRLAEHDGNIYLDLCDDAWRAVAIDRNGYRVVDHPPVRFHRTTGMQSLPEPKAGGSIEALWRYVNLPDRPSRMLFVSVLVQAMRPTGPYPVLVLQGPQGSAKSVASRVFRRLVDPNKSAVRAAPRTVRDLMIAANNGRVLAYDNLSHVAAETSDALCRVSTGGGFGARLLYSDDDECLIDVQRPIVLNGIEELATRGDLLDRAVILNLPPIPAEQRRSESALWNTFDHDLPQLLGALLDGVAEGLRTVDQFELGSLPRMADFCQWAFACAPAFGWTGDELLTAYNGNRNAANSLALEASPVAAVLLNWLGEAWTGTATELLDHLTEVAGERVTKQQSWPKIPRALSNALRRLAPNLQQVGVSIGFSHGAERTISLIRTGV